MPVKYNRPLSIGDLARREEHDPKESRSTFLARKQRIRRQLRALEKQCPGTTFRFTPKGKTFTSLALLRRALPALVDTGQVSVDDLAKIQDETRELRAMLRALGSRYRDMKKRLDGLSQTNTKM